MQDSSLCQLCPTYIKEIVPVFCKRAKLSKLFKHMMIWYVCCFLRFILSDSVLEMLSLGTKQKLNWSFSNKEFFHTTFFSDSSIYSLLSYFKMFFKEGLYSFSSCISKTNFLLKVCLNNSILEKINLLNILNYTALKRHSYPMVWLSKIYLFKI